MKADQDGFLVKWQGKSHRDNTWESEASLIALGAGKKLENFLKSAQEMEDEDLEELKVPERVISFHEDDETGKIFYLVKWSGVPYSGCTWEDSEELPEEANKLIDEYLFRRESGGIATVAKRYHSQCSFQKMTTLPPYLSSHGQLRPYQMEGVNWLVYSWTKGINVILADEMGLGKTVQTVCFLSCLFNEYAFSGPVLVVVPLSTIAAWYREFSRWSPEVSVLLYVGDRQSRATQRRYDWFSNSDVNRNAHGKVRPLFHVLLTTYELTLKDEEFLSQIDWRMLIIDEGHRLKNSGSQLHECLDRIGSASRLLITGTPLQNTLSELWSLLHFLMPKDFPDYDSFEVKYGTNDVDDNGEATAKRLAALHAILKPHILRRMKKDVEASLPAKTERILRVEMSAKQANLSKLVLTKNYKELASQTKGVTSLNNVLLELKKICNHPNLLSKEDHGAGSLQELVMDCGKMALLDQLMCRLKKDSHRVLVFSQMVKMLDIIEDYIRLKGWKFQRLDGSTSADQRKKSIAEFNQPNSPDFCFLLSTRAGGLGINLETADTVIIYDSDWNPQNDLQAMARAHRIGQTKSVNIYRLVTKNSVEETILEKAKQKMILDHLVIQSMDTGTIKNSQKAFTRDDLQAILKFGAQELFSKEPSNQTLDLDDILARADSVDTAAAVSGKDELFDQFKVADFETASFNHNKTWDEILPTEEVEKAKELIAEEEKLNKEVALQEALLTTATKRKRQAHSSFIKMEALSSGKGSGLRKAIGSLTKTQSRDLVASVLKFGLLDDRFDVIYEDFKRKNPDIPKAPALRCFNEVKGLLHGAEGDSARLSTDAHVNLSQLKTRHDMLSFLHRRIGGSYPSFKITEKGIKSVATVGTHRWMINWRTPVDDEALLCAVHKHGFGEWLTIADDPSFDLARLKESLVEHKNDATFLPKDLHLGRRVENVLTHMMADANVNSDQSEAPPKIKRESTPSKSNKEVDSDGKELRKLLKPVREELAFIAGISKDSLGESLGRLKESLKVVGDHISGLDDPSPAWTYICQFWPTEISPSALQQFYERVQSSAN